MIKTIYSGEGHCGSITCAWFYSMVLYQVMEKLRQMIRPDQFILLKVVKSTLEFIRFEGELENKNLIKVVISRLDGKTIKLSGFPEQLKGQSRSRSRDYLVVTDKVHPFLGMEKSCRISIDTQ